MGDPTLVNYNSQFIVAKAFKYLCAKSFARLRVTSKRLAHVIKAVYKSRHFCINIPELDPNKPTQGQ